MSRTKSAFSIETTLAMPEWLYQKYVAEGLGCPDIAKLTGRDSNQTDITATLRKMGATVTPTHAVGNGFPDLAVGFQGVTLLVEIEDGSKPPSKRKLTPDEQEWHDNWRGQVAIVESVEDAVRLLNGVGHEPDRASLLRTIQVQDAEIQRLKAELYEVRT